MTTALPKLVFTAIVLATVMSIPAQAQVTFRTLAKWDGSDGSNPYAGLVQGRDGNFYGATWAGGASDNQCWENSCGTFFRITPGGQLTKLYNFCPQSDCTNGAEPITAPVLSTDGSFYGTTPFGGVPYVAEAGTVFKITTTGKLTRLYGFCPHENCAGGGEPEAGLVQGSDGNFYGTAVRGGLTYYVCGLDGTCGTVFKVTPTGKLTTLHKFCTEFNCTDGNNPLAPMVEGSDGNFYGTTWGGDVTSGTVFKITPTGKLTTIYTFCASCGDGFGPTAGLQQGPDGNFYGTTVSGGSSSCYQGCGTVFKITPEGKLTTIYTFCCSDGEFPNGLVLGTDGSFYGTTVNGDRNSCHNGCGTVFKITPDGDFTTIHRFCGQGCGEGFYPYAALIQGTDGRFYGTTWAGGHSGCSSGNQGCGTVFQISTGLGPFVALVNDAGKVGTEVQILGQGFTGTTAVSFNGAAAKFNVVSNTYLTATLPKGATTGYVAVATPKNKLKSNREFRVTP